MSEFSAFRRVAVVLVTVAAAALFVLGCVRPGPPAEAEVVHRLGFRGTVDGFTSWYGSYVMGSLGEAWCIDHGIAAPDPALVYEPTTPEVGSTTRTAMAWMVGRHGFTTDPVTSAALMLALHDLMGAVYPGGRLDVDRLTPSRLAGFGGAEAAVLARARTLKAEALRRSSLRGPFGLALAADPVEVGGEGTLRARVTDAGGLPVPGAIVLVSGDGATFDHHHAETGGDGIVEVGFEATSADPTVVAHAVMPDLDLAAFAPTRRRAQRVVVPRQVVVEQALDVTSVEVPPPPGGVIVHKSGDAIEVAPITGARFELRLPTGEVVAEITIGDDGSSDPIEVAPGTYELVETQPPAGYHAAAPVDAEVVSGQVVHIDVHDRARPGSLTVSKVDAASQEPLAGAVLEIRSGAPSGPGSEVVASVESVTGPVTVDRLDWGTYWVVEVAAPQGYEVAPEPVEVFVAPGGETTVVVADQPAEPETPAPPPTSSTSTSTPGMSTTSTSSPGTSTTSTSTTEPVAPVPARPVAELPRTGSTTMSTTLVGAGLVFLGLAMTVGADLGPDGRIRPFRRWRRPRPGPRRRGRARSSAGGWRTRRRPPPPS